MRTISRVISVALVFASLLFTTTVSAQTSLANDQQVTLSGKMVIKGHGWQKFFVVEPEKPYRLMFDREDGGPATSREIAFYLFGQTEQVERLKNHRITVTGKIQLNQPSPYYWQGTMIQANILRASTGLVLDAKPELPSEKTWSNGPKVFVVAIRMSPDHILPNYSVLTPSYLTGQIPPGFGCGVNGGGDLLNCSCPKGYAGSRTGTLKSGRFVALDTNSVLQIKIGEDTTHPITVAAECIRSKNPDQDSQ